MTIKDVDIMGRKLLCLLLIISLLFCLTPPLKASASGMVFISCNDTLLDLSSAPYYSGGNYYVPYWVFGTFGVYYSYFAESSTAMLYSGQSKYFFDMVNGGSFDANEVTYSDSAIFRGGVVYVPVRFICERFGLSWSYTSGAEYGDILRIKNSSVILSDKDFLSAAASLMKYYYNMATMGTDGENAQPPEQPTPTPTPTTTPEAPPKEIVLSFSGLPGEEALDALEEKKLRACFFLTADDVRADPDMVRRISGSGNKLGVLLDPEDCEGSFEEARELLFEAAKVCAVMVSSNTGEDICAEFASERGLAYKYAGVVASGSIYSVTGELETPGPEQDVRVLCGEETGSLIKGLIQYFAGGNFRVRPLLEA